MSESPRKQNPSTLTVGSSSSRSLLDSAFESLPKEQRDALIKSAIEKKLELDVEEIKTGRRHAASAIDMQNTVRQISEIESSTKSDYRVKADFETASGKTSIEVTKSNNTTVIVVVVVIAVIFLIVFAR